MAVAELSIVPVGVPSTSLSSFVAQVLRVIKESSLQYELTAMGTILSGDVDEIWEVVRTVHESCFGEDVSRVLTTLKIDDRRDRTGSPEQKVRSVLEKLDK